MIEKGGVSSPPFLLGALLRERRGNGFEYYLLIFLALHGEVSYRRKKLSEENSKMPHTGEKAHE
ncbi:hypothetical protein [Syntrophus gentianae]|uniref:hypothetical protein n=1 Tax=Syntrophus gentianae TaxID=43775 RepID=UPI0011139FA0|nr:hypothetical protein [Syntrophus gentianae]